MDSPRAALVLLAITLAPALLGCPAVYPELSTRTRAVHAEQALDPPPPDDLRYLRFVSGTVPAMRRDGRPWGSAPGKAPDTYAKLLVNEVELLRTPVQSGSFKPTWPGGPKGNFRVGTKDRLRLELWDAKSINDEPVGIRELGHPSEDAFLNRQIVVDFDSGASVTLAFEPAHALLGLGLWYELRTDSCYVTRMLEGSPAQRAGILPDDEVIKLAGRDVHVMTPNEIRSKFNAVPPAGLTVTVKHPTGATLDAVLKEGPIYPAFDQFGSLE